MYDGGADLHDSFALSGEPMAEQLARAFGGLKLEQFNGTKIAETNVQQRQIRKEYLDYWNSTTEVSGTGRPVDAVIAPLAPFPAARPKMYAYYGYTTFVNLLDYTSVVVPITTADKNVDIADKDYKPLNDEDKICYESCKLCGTMFF
jgi:amidase